MVILKKTKFLSGLAVIQFLRISLVLVVGSTRQQPINFGFIISLPWDISNTLRAPLAGPMSILLSGFLAIICFAGLAFAPIWYLFGFPKRRYHLHDIPDSRALSPDISFLETVSSNTNISLDGSFRLNSRPFLQVNEVVTLADNTNDFTGNFFFFYPPITESCKQLLACHAHGFVPFMPNILIRILTVFSRRSTKIQEKYVTAVKTGLGDQSFCRKLYDSCPVSIGSLARMVLMHNIPENLRSQWNIQDM